MLQVTFEVARARVGTSVRMRSARELRVVERECAMFGRLVSIGDSWPGGRYMQVWFMQIQQGV